MSSCVNISHPEYKKLESHASENNINSLVLEFLVSDWQSKNNSTQFPSLDELRLANIPAPRRQQLAKFSDTYGLKGALAIIREYNRVNKLADKNIPGIREINNFLMQNGSRVAVVKRLLKYESNEAGFLRALTGIVHKDSNGRIVVTRGIGESQLGPRGQVFRKEVFNKNLNTMKKLAEKFPNTFKLIPGQSANTVFVEITPPTSSKVEYYQLDESRVTYDVQVQESQVSPITLESQLDGTPSIEEQSDLIDKKIIEFASKLGISVQAVEEIKTRMGNDAVAVANMLEQSIKYVEGKVAKDTLPEELAHFIVEGMIDHPAIKEAMDLVEQTELYAEMYERYVEEYDGDVNKVKKEIVGKLLAQSMINAVEESDLTLLGKLKKVFQKILRLFFNRVRSVDEQIIENFKSISEKVALGDTTGFKTVKTNNEFYQLGGTPITEKLEQAEEAYQEDAGPLKGLSPKLKEMIKFRAKRLAIYAQKMGTSKLTKKEKAIMYSINEKYENDLTTLGIIEYLKITEREMAAANKRISRFSKIELTEADAKDAIATLKQIQDFVIAVTPIIENLKGSLQYSEDFEHKAALVEAVNSISNNVGSINSYYKDQSIKLLADVLQPYAEKNPNFDREAFEETMRFAEKDISFTRRFLDSMAESGNEFLAVIDRFVKDEFEAARLEADGKIKKLLSLNEKLEQNGIDSSEFLERDADGNLTGYFISDVNRGAYERELEDFQSTLNNSMGIPQDKIKRYNIFNSIGSFRFWYDYNKDKAAIKNIEKDFRSKNKFANQEMFLEAFQEEVEKRYRQKWATWLQDNTESLSEEERDALIEQKRQDIYKAIVTEKLDPVTIKQQEKNAEEAFNEWKADNIRFSRYLQNTEGDGVYYVKDLAKPKQSKYGNKQAYGAVMSHPIKRQYLRYVQEVMLEYDRVLPETYQMNGKIPRVRKDWFERAKKKTVKENLQSIKDEVIKQADDTEFGLTDEQGNTVHTVPMFYTKGVELDQLTEDTTAIISLFIESAERYKHMSNIVDVVELAKDVSKDMKIGDGGKKDLLSQASNKITSTLFKDSKAIKSVDGGKIADRLSDYLETVMYGIQKHNEGTIKAMGMELDKAKMMDVFNRYVAINNLALNVYAGIANVTLGRALTRQEALAGQYFNMKDLIEADKNYYKHLPGVLKDIGRRYSDNKLRLFLEKTDALQDHKTKLQNLNTDRSRIGKLFNTSNLFFTTHAGEHYNQSRVVLAVANTIRVKDAKGNEMSLFDAMEVTDNDLVIPEGIKKLDGSDFTQKDFIAFVVRSKAVNKRMHGIYNDIDAAEIQRYALGRMAIMFRRFLKPGFNRRWERKKFNYELNEEVEGYYMTAARFLGQLARELSKSKFDIKANWSKLSPGDRANLIRAMYEVTYLISLATLGALLEGALEGGDDDDEWALNMMAYQVNRLYSELFFYLNLKETTRLLKSPAAGISVAEGLIDILYVMSPLDYAINDEPLWNVYKEGTADEELYLTRNVKKAIPLWKTISGLGEPETKLRFFTSN